MTQRKLLNGFLDVAVLAIALIGIAAAAYIAGRAFAALFGVSI